jgi:hypothetical protein
MKKVAKEFKKVIIKEFDGYLKAIGFKKVRHRTDDISFEIIYRQEERYIRFSSSLHPRDYPLFFSISLGEGGNDFPESGWNYIPLDLIIKNESLSDFEKSKDVFSIGFGITHDEIADKVKESRQFLERYGQSFLSKDLQQFKKLRAEQNKSREPYKIYTPQKDGMYKMEYEKKSSNLKEKYSE